MSDRWLRLDFSSSKLEALCEQLTAKATRLEQVLFTRVQMLTLMLSSKVVAKLSNQVLHVRTGVLRGSVNANTTDEAARITGTVQSSAGPAFYGRFHEFGVPHAWQIVASRSKALAFQLSVKQNAQKVFAKSVVHPPLPERSFMRSSLDESREEIIRQVAESVVQVLKEK